MHEAGLLAAAVAQALAAGEPEAGKGSNIVGARRPARLVIRVHDPVHVAPESARMHAELALRARGFTGVPIEVTADPVTCVLCDEPNEVTPDHPFCAACGWPLPDRGGHAVDASVRWADEVLA